jgi:hypothetical protein
MGPCNSCRFVDGRQRYWIYDSYNMHSVCSGHMECSFAFRDEAASGLRENDPELAQWRW